MKVISVHQPWAQLIADRRRHILIKYWPLESGRFAIHASATVDEEKCREFGYDPVTIPRRAIVATVEVKKCFARSQARESKFDKHSNPKVKEDRQYAIVVRTIEKLRKPIETPCRVGQRIWEYNWQAIGTTSASTRRESNPENK